MPPNTDDAPEGTFRRYLGGDVVFGAGVVNLTSSVSICSGDDESFMLTKLPTWFGP